MNAAGVEFRKPFLKTPQLGVTERSPKTAIENQGNGLRPRGCAEQIAKANGLSTLIQQNKVWCQLPDARGTSRGRDLSQDIKDFVAEQRDNKHSNRGQDR